jgi:hypothetical protein
MRARIDVSEVEAQTKIRAKYLRALENEEWDLLPGPTYVKSFLRTYAEALDLDAKLLVDEYKLRHERLSEVELQPINAAAPGRERRKTGPVIPPGAVVTIILVGLVAALYSLGSCGKDDTPPAADQPAATQPAARSTPAAAPPAVAPVRRRSTVRLQIIGTGDVNVCLKGGDRTLVNGATLGAGDRTASFNSRHFRLTLGNNNAILRINGKDRRVPASSDPIGLTITPARGRRPLPASKRPVCR